MTNSAKSRLNKVTFTVTDEQLNDWLDHGVDSWADLRNSKGNDWMTGVTFRYDRESDEEGDLQGKIKVTRPKILKGLGVMAKEAPWALAAMLEGKDDMETCDAFLQCIVFGKLIYG